MLEPLSWTDDRVTLLKQLQADGLSCSQIAGELGGVTRNAVIGKLARLGLSGLGAPRTARARAPRAPRAPRPPRARMRITAQRHVMTVFDCEPEPEVVEADIPIAQRCSLVDLNDEKCHWPVGDPATPEFFFCGGKANAGTAYCGWHNRVAYQPASVRRDRRPAAASPLAAARRWS